MPDSNIEIWKWIAGIIGSFWTALTMFILRGMSNRIKSVEDKHNALEIKVAEKLATKADVRRLEDKIDVLIARGK